MNLRQKLVDYGKRQSFRPDFFSLFINHLYFQRKFLFQQIKSLAPNLQGGALLDFGCGRKPYRELFRVDQYIGVDLKTSGHDHRWSEVDAYYDGRTIPFADGHFDHVFCAEVLEHIFEPEAILKEIGRVLKPGARGVFTVPFCWNEHEVPWDYGRYTSFGLRHLLEKCGFKVLRMEKTGHFISMLFQLAAIYVHNLFRSRHEVLNALGCLLFISPINLAGLIFCAILPRNYTLYHNLVVLVEKS